MKLLNKSFLIIGLFLFTLIYAQESNIVPITSRVNYQAEVAPPDKIINGQWVGVGLKRKHAIGYDNNILFRGNPSFHFYLNKDDNTEGGHSGEMKGRAELSYCYAVANDFINYTKEEYLWEVLARTVYFHAKEWCRQASSMSYSFSIYVPDTTLNNIKSIFAQWHGMPDRTLLQTPDGVVKKVTKKEFAKLCETMYFKQEKGYDIKTGLPSGLIIQEGGFPPLSFGFDHAFFYILANSDRKWFSDINDRCLANVIKDKILVPVKSTYKESTLAYKAPFCDFPKNKWVTFYIKVRWTKYDFEKEDIVRPGLLDVIMSYKDAPKSINTQIINNVTIMLGANNLQGYYFKFGIYRTANNKVPVSYNLANYAEKYNIFEQE